MAKCSECGARFKLKDTIEAVVEEYDDEDLVDDEIEELCPDCALTRLHSYEQAGYDAEYGDWE